MCPSEHLQLIGWCCVADLIRCDTEKILDQKQRQSDMKGSVNNGTERKNPGKSGINRRCH